MGYSRPALAALEAILLLVIVSAGLALLAGQTESVRNTLRQDMATRQLALLGEALTVYYLDTGTFPPGQEDLSAGEAFRTLRALPSAGRVLSAWSPGPSILPADQPADPWRTPYRFIAREFDPDGQVAANGGWPSFVSAGPDTAFGDRTNARAETDNRHTDELLDARPDQPH
jgi:type II secretory pathway pseudopilin PulG